MPAIPDRILTVIGVCAGVILIAASMAINAEFAYSRAVDQHLAIIYAAAAAAADLIKSLFALYALRAWQARQRVRAGAAVVFTVLGTLLSLSSAFGLIAESRNARFVDRASLNERLGHVRTQRSDAERERSGIKDARSVVELQSSIDAILDRPATAGQRVRGTVRSVWNRCQALDRSTRESCKEVSELRDELGRAIATARLKQEIAQLWVEEEELRKKGAGQEADGQGGVFARLFGTTIERMNIALAVLLALVIEAGSSLGLFIVTGHDRGSLSKAAVEAETEVAEKVPLGVEDYWLERLFPAVGERVSVARIVEDYGAYCEGAGVAAMEPHVFEEAFRDICSKIGLKISNGFAVGVRVGDGETRKVA